MAAFGAAAAILYGFGAAVPAGAESPFHTGVWQVNTESGPVGLIVSDWLIFDDGLPSRWIYRKSGTNDENQFDFVIRNMGESAFAPVAVQVYRTGEHEMKYTVTQRGQTPVTNPSKRLSQPDYKNSCLSVEIGRTALRHLGRHQQVNVQETDRFAKQPDDRRQ